MVKDDEEIELLRLAAQRRRPGRHADRRRAARRPDGGGRRPGGPRAPRGRGPRARRCSRSSRAGPNSASPHHEASDRVIQAGEPIVLDIGGTLGGYDSDITRTLWVTGGDPANGPDEGSGTSSPSLRRAQRRPRPRSGPASGRGDRRGGARDHRRRRLRRARSSIGRVTDRPRGPRGPVLVAGTPNRCDRAWRSAWSPASTSRAAMGSGIEDIVVCGPDGPIVLDGPGPRPAGGHGDLIATGDSCAGQVRARGPAPPSWRLTAHDLERRAVFGATCQPALAHPRPDGMLHQGPRRLGAVYPNPFGHRRTVPAKTR